MERHTYSQPHSDMAPDDADDLLGDSDAEDHHQQHQQQQHHQHQRSSGSNGGGGSGGSMNQAGRVLLMAAATAVFLAVLAFYLGDPLSLYYAAGDEPDPLGVGVGAKGNSPEQVLDALVSAIDAQENKRAQQSADSHSVEDAKLEGADGDGGTGRPVGSAVNSSSSATEAELMSLRSKRLKRQAEAQQAARQSLQRVFDELAEMGAPGVDENGKEDEQKHIEGGKGQDTVKEKGG